MRVTLCVLVTLLCSIVISTNIIGYEACSYDEFMCVDGECIHEDYECDGDDDCDDESDELHCESLSCPNNTHRCIDGKCISKSRRCDGRRDCSDSSDEEGCDCSNTSLFRCKDGNKCISENFKCDGVNDCSDNSDEADCECTRFRCDSGECIPEDWACDDDPDCLDSSDELNCKKACSFDEFQCGNGDCILISYFCDEDDDCNDGSDELNCLASKSSNTPRINNNRPFTSTENFVSTSSEAYYCPPGYCLNGGTCEIIDNTEHCRCSADYKGRRCNISKTESRYPTDIYQIVSRCTTASVSGIALLLCVTSRVVF